MIRRSILRLAAVAGFAPSVQVSDSTPEDKGLLEDFWERCGPVARRYHGVQILLQPEAGDGGPRRMKIGQKRFLEGMHCCAAVDSRSGSPSDSRTRDSFLREWRTAESQFAESRFGAGYHASLQTLVFVKMVSGESTPNSLRYEVVDTAPNHCLEIYAPWVRDRQDLRQASTRK